ncbi:MAG: O-antigen ligase family protein [Bacteroidales bacterium]|nr:O-antigen ligase family protein [Bacteroidales bacterium]
MKLLHTKINLEYWLWALVWFTLPISIRLNSIAIALVAVAVLVNFFKKPFVISKDYLIPFFFALLFFLTQLIGVRGSMSSLTTWKEVEQLLPLIIFPVLFMTSRTNNDEFSQASLKALVSAIIICGIIMIGESALVFFKTQDVSVFTYHKLCEPFSSGAIFFSFFIVISLLRMDIIIDSFTTSFQKYAIVIFLLLLLFLLASKMILLPGLVLLAVKYRRNLFTFLPKNKLVVPILFILFLLLLVPVLQRFKDILNPRIDIVMNDKFNYDSPLNGLNLRIIQARFGIEILNDNEAWLFGVGIDKAQELLNDKYVNYGLHTGYNDDFDKGYLDYNFHNQYIEIAVRSGLLGLFSLLAMVFLLIIIIIKRQTFVLGWELILLLLFFITESVLERQIGIVYFCLIYSSYFPLKND